eukprot:9310420-Ditylum_brightwellii.AAC.1
MAMTAVILIWYTTAMIQYHQMSPRTKTTVNRMMMKINQVPVINQLVHIQTVQKSLYVQMKHIIFMIMIHRPTPLSLQE